MYFGDVYLTEISSNNEFGIGGRLSVYWTEYQQMFSGVINSS